MWAICVTWLAMMIRVARAEKARLGAAARPRPDRPPPRSVQQSTSAICTSSSPIHPFRVRLGPRHEEVGGHPHAQPVAGADGDRGHAAQEPREDLRRRLAESLPGRGAEAGPAAGVRVGRPGASARRAGPRRRPPRTSTRSAGPPGRPARSRRWRSGRGRPGRPTGRPATPAGGTRPRAGPGPAARRPAPSRGALRRAARGCAGGRPSRTGSPPARAPGPVKSPSSCVTSTALSTDPS